MVKIIEILFLMGISVSTAFIAVMIYLAALITDIIN